MLTPGNRKLGGALIWGFTLPSGSADVCVGLTPTCRRWCYAARTEAYRPAVAAHARRNLALSHAPDFARRVRAFLVAHAVRVVRIHVGGEFYSARYACTWLKVVRRSPRVRFFTYTRAWRVPAVKAVIDEMAAVPNARVWYSCDRDTGVPADRPPGVRVAWLMAAADDPPPVGADLVFRVQGLRRQPRGEAAGVPVCPAEDGRRRARPATCDRCGVCWNSSRDGDPRRISLRPMTPPIDRA